MQRKDQLWQTCTGNTEQCVNMRIMVRLTSKYSFCLNTSPLGPCHWMLCSANKIAQWAATIKAIQSMEEFASAARPANPRNRKSTTLAQQNSLTMPYITTGLTTGKVWPSQSSHSSADHVVFFQWTHRRIGRGPPHSAEPPTMDERMSGRSQWITSRPALGPCLYVWTYIHVQYVCIYITYYVIQYIYSIYIYIYQRERDRYLLYYKYNIYVYIYIYTHVYTYIYIQYSAVFTHAPPSKKCGETSPPGQKARLPAAGSSPSSVRPRHPATSLGAQHWPLGEATWLLVQSSLSSVPYTELWNLWHSWMFGWPLL